MTERITLAQAPWKPSSLNPREYCSACVYFGRNLDTAAYPVLVEKPDCCGLGFLAGDSGCTEMRTDNCSMRKAR